MSMKNLAPVALAASLLALAASVAPSATLAQDKGLYLEGRAAASIPPDADYDVPGTDIEASFDTGWAAGAGLGYAYGNGFRSELEFHYHKNDVDTVAGASGAGDVDAIGLLINGYYDFLPNQKFRPYIGVGFGGARVSANSISPVAGSSVDDSDSDFAWQGMAGVSYAVSERIKLSLGYRYFSVPNLSYTSAAGASVDSNYDSHDVMVGFRWSFGAPKPMMPPPAKAAPVAAPTPMAKPAPAPAPAPMAKPEPAPAPVTRNFLVFFDWDSSALTPQAQSIVRSAAAEAKRVGSARISATGHADRSGTIRYNQRLSNRRAVAVRNMLQQLGIPQNEIVIVAKGESEPLVPTADGVREPQNRRVEIILE